ncbi:membrane protein insertase YidC [Mycoplasma capricolum subsp. capripneumoniae]|uniref:membrane protein insertase YidC n=1 Tax=Mycoplasma capricolum TaxID=2095 RepID=UPI001404B287|nr:membrane protein insertase YidC [Mycoplasma capricolum]QIN45450.1 membrane protein insertase YidC [Mycoplasma capricolum subsp. capripneumoniae]WGD33490.1 Membrane protein insertase YidC [Mycoplasma capricolum subsp. capripneumoniae]
MYKQSDKVMSYLNASKNKKAPKTKKEIFKVVIKWLKVFGFLFILVSMLWGCVQMYQAQYSVNQIVDMTGKSVYTPGVSFEIILSSLGEQGSKVHHFVYDKGSFFEYGYNAITSWKETFKLTQSPFYGFFVYPTAWILAGMIKLFSGTLNPLLDKSSQLSYGISSIFAIFLTTLLIKGITLSFGWKSQINQEKMQDIQLKVADIQAKYKDKKDMQSKQKQQLEIQALYKKENMSQFSALAGSFAPLPFLFAIYAIVRSTRALKIASVGPIALIEGPWQQITAGNYIYIIILAIYLPLQAVSMLLPTLLQMKKQKSITLTEAQKKSRKKQLTMQVVMMFVFIIIIVSVATGVCIYWIFSSVLQIIQTYAFYLYSEKKRKAGNQERQRRLRQMERMNLK